MLKVLLLCGFNLHIDYKVDQQIGRTIQISIPIVKLSIRVKFNLLPMADLLIPLKVSIYRLKKSSVVLFIRLAKR